MYQIINRVVLLCAIISIIISCVCCASLSASEQKKYKQLIEGQGLYSVNDNVSIYTVNNFKSKLYGQKHGILLEFYNSWCGFCQRFAPSWKALATDVREWKDHIDIGAIDCSDEDNSPICREFEILGYPTLRYFHEDYQEGPKKLGIDVKKGENVDALRRSLINQMLKEQTDGRGQQWPQLLPYTNPDVIDIFNNVPESVKYTFVIVESQPNMSAEIAMDLHKSPQIIIRSVTQNNTAFLNNYHINSYPKLLAIKRLDKSVEHFKDEDIVNREKIITTIKEFLKPKGIEITQRKTENIFKGKWIESEVPDLAALLKERERQNLRQKVKQMGDVVFQMDLETALRYSLMHEIATTKVIDGEKLQALKNYLDVILKYFPMGRKGKNFMEDLVTEISSHGESVQGEVIANFLRPINNEEEGIFSSPLQWLGCSGSSTKYRGYPCGMWKMFHYLTVNAAEQNLNKENTNPREVLEAMLGYIKNFFGCQDCSQHFQEMAKRNGIHNVTELNSSIIWLWVAHNEVNKRLSGDSTEDPEYQKIQFPSVNNCPKCKDSDDKWNLTEVLNYLRHMYSSINVRYLGSDTKILHDGLGGTPRTKRSTSWVVINRMDVSMCFILYVSCFGLLVLIVRQFLKKGYKKKMYIHDLLGKV